MKIHKNLKGQTFGKLLIISDPIRKNGYIKYECKCDCRNTIKTFSYSLTNNKTTSCGCYGKTQRAKSNTKHGMSNDRFYQIWEGIVRRSKSNIQKEKQPTYKKCTIDKDWLNFINFKNDMHESYQIFINKFNILPEIDKDIKGDSYYSKETCIWVSPKTNRAESILRKHGYSYKYDEANDVLTKISRTFND